MNRQQTKKILDNLRQMRLPIMAEQILAMSENNEISTISVAELLERISTEELMSRKNNTIKRLKKNANLSQKDARIEEIDYRPQRAINISLINQLKTNDYICKKRNVILLGACGTGKSYIANALGNHACENFYSTYYCRMYEFIDNCNLAEMNKGSHYSEIEKHLKYDVLIIDDFLIHELSSKEVEYLFNLIDYRHNRKSTIICSQLEISEWHGRLCGSLLADSILDRLTSNAYQLVLQGDSLRKSH